jgi:outer membrane protein TolC
VERAASTRPDVLVAENNVRIANLEVAKQKGYWLPVITFDGGYRAQQSPFPASNYAYGALRFTVPIFQSGEVIGRVAGARERELQANLFLEDARLEAREDVRRALVALRAAETSLQLAREQLAAAEAEYAQTTELYRAQEVTSVDVTQSEVSLATARRAVAEEILNRDLALLRVWYEAGAIKEALNVADHSSAVTE